MWDNMCFDRQGRPITVEQYTELLVDDDYKRVALTTVGPYAVSTVWLGADHSFGTGGPPLIFETMVFATEGGTADLSHDLDCRRYATEDEARRGHEEFVVLIGALTQATPEGEECR